MVVNQMRRDPVTGRWTIVLMNEINVEELIVQPGPVKSDGKKCQFCEGNEKSTPSEIASVRQTGTNKNEPGWRVRVIPDKKPVLQIYGNINNRGLGLYDVLDGIGAHEIVIETPRHHETLVDFSEEHIVEILFTYRDRILDLKKDVRFRYILVHKNFSEAVGHTVNHSYSFIIGSPVTPRQVRDELLNAKAYYGYKERCIFCDIIYQELNDKERMVIEDGIFLGFTPFASRRPFEIWILPQHHESFFELTGEIKTLAKMIKEIVMKIYRVLNEREYMLVIHSAPNLTSGKKRGYWDTLENDFHWHIELMPRLRTYSSYETSSGFPINSVPPEEVARILRSVQ